MEKVAYEFNSKHLGKAFMEELLEMGYKDDGFVPEVDTSIINVNKNKVFGLMFNHRLYSPDKVFNLESQYTEALAFAKEQIDPEFKEGDWVVGDDNMGNKNIIAKIISISQENRHGNYWIESTHNKYGIYFIGETLRYATKEEIEQALIKEAERRGYKEGTDIIGAEAGDGRGVIKDQDFSYNDNTDDLYVYTTNGHMSVYYRGEWASIVTDAQCNKRCTCEIIEDKLEIAGYEVTIDPNDIQIGCKCIDRKKFNSFIDVFCDIGYDEAKSILWANSEIKLLKQLSKIQEKL